MKSTEQIIDNYRHEMVNDLVQLISIPSVSSDRESTEQALDYVLNLAKDHGFKVYTTSTKQIGIIEYGSGDETIGTAVHVDVVPEGDRTLWNTDPFKGTVIDNKVIGRGAYDDKGAVIAVLYALIAVDEAGITPRKKVQIIVGTQEEVEWSDLQEFDREMTYPDYGFTPDGVFPIQNTEKGYVDMELSFTNQGTKDTKAKATITELWAGFAKNMIPETATARIKGSYQYLADVEKMLESHIDSDMITIEHGNSDLTNIDHTTDACITVTARGSSAHSSVPEKGDNAIWRLADFIGSLDLTDNAEFKAMTFAREVLAGCYYGEKLGFDEEEYLNEDNSCEGIFVHKTTVSPTYLRSEINKVTLSINMRTRYGTVREDITRAFETVKKNYSIADFELVDYSEPVLVMPDRKFIKMMADSYEKVTGKKNYFALERGTTYMKAFPNTVIWGPLDEDGYRCFHQENEEFDIDTMVTACKVYSEYYARALSSDEPLK